MAEQKTYVPKSSAKEITFNDGGSMMKVSFHASTLAEFVKNHANEKGYINLCVTKRREPGKFGDTHCVWLDTWKPKQQAPQREQPTRADLPPGGLFPAAAAGDDKKEDDVPF